MDQKVAFSKESYTFNRMSDFQKSRFEMLKKEVDDIKSSEPYKLDSHVLFSLATCYELGQGCEANHLLALPLYIISAMKKHPDSIEWVKEHIYKNAEHCCICLDGKAVIINFPCMHIACCEKCSDKIKTCPLCREKIIQIIHLNRVIKCDNNKPRHFKYDN